MRTRTGLPFVCTKYMKMLLNSVVSRVQRNFKVTLHHQLWMANHPHIILTAKDKRECTNFYGEVQKQLTEAVKRLTGLKHLSLWNRNATSVIALHDVGTVCYRIAYLYANPARAHLVDTIKEYPGVSSYTAFRQNLHSELEASHSSVHPWVRAPFVEPLPQSRRISRLADQALCRKWKKMASESHELKIFPNAWMKRFGITNKEQVAQTNKDILQILFGLEQEARDMRKKKGKRVASRAQLQTEALDVFSYRPSKPSRRISVYSIDSKLRVYLIKQYQKFRDECKRCYLAWKQGDFTVQWPKGAFPPSRPHSVNHFAPSDSPIFQG